MKVLPIHKEITNYLQKRGLGNKFAKQISLFITNPKHPSLNFELLEPKHLRFYSFRIDRKYRAIFIFRDYDTIEIIDANNHYH